MQLFIIDPTLSLRVPLYPTRILERPDLRASATLQFRCALLDELLNEYISAQDTYWGRRRMVMHIQSTFDSRNTNNLASLALP